MARKSLKQIVEDETIKKIRKPRAKKESATKIVKKEESIDEMRNRIIKEIEKTQKIKKKEVSNNRSGKINYNEEIKPLEKLEIPPEIWKKEYEKNPKYFFCEWIKKYCNDNNFIIQRDQKLQSYIDKYGVWVHMKS